MPSWARCSGAGTVSLGRVLQHPSGIRLLLQQVSPVAEAVLRLHVTRASSLRHTSDTSSRSRALPSRAARGAHNRSTRSTQRARLPLAHPCVPNGGRGHLRHRSWDRL
jgi:hypothetical protein